jgi:A/G-specific adenine glycosylase
LPLDTALFRRKLHAWYRLHARKLPWRGVTDPYIIWVSEVMLQQTRVAAVIEHYHRFLARFPTVAALAAAPESEVLAAWSGLGYYRRARMMHRAAKVVAGELGGGFPTTAAALRLLPGIGEYTSAAIASIAFGESVAVLDGNVERVLLRIAGRPEETTAASKNFLRQLAAELVPRSHSADHNQAMMELGATVCLPRNPLCLHCPVYALCKTRGEHPTPPRGKAKSKAAACLLAQRGHGPAAEVLLAIRPVDASLMAGMYELPPLPLDAIAGREPILRLRHAITDTVYAVEIYEQETGTEVAVGPTVPTSLHWTLAARLREIPLTGLARKVLRKLRLMP